MSIPPQEFIRSLDDEQRLLVALVRDLYGGDWQQMVEDLRTRLESRNRLESLAQRMRRHLQEIENFRSYETAHGVKLVDYYEGE